MPVREAVLKTEDVEAAAGQCGVRVVKDAAGRIVSYGDAAPLASSGHEQGEMDGKDVTGVWGSPAALGGRAGTLPPGSEESDDDDEDALADELVKNEELRARIAKGETHAAPDTRERLEKAHRRLEHAYLARHSQGYARARLGKADERSRRRRHRVI